MEVTVREKTLDRFSKMAPVWFWAIIMGLYTAFVLQNLWNWFVTPALNFAHVSYWQMFGINLLVQMVRGRDTIVEQDHWERAANMLYACVPPDKQQAVDEKLKATTEDVWVKCAVDIFSRSVGNTVSLGVGWVVHTLFL